MRTCCCALFTYHLVDSMKHTITSCSWSNSSVESTGHMILTYLHTTRRALESGIHVHIHTYTVQELLEVRTYIYIHTYIHTYMYTYNRELPEERVPLLDGNVERLTATLKQLANRS